MLDGNYRDEVYKEPRLQISTGDGSTAINDFFHLVIISREETED